MRDVSVIVCTHRAERWPWLTECLESLKQQSEAPLEVIVVVDGDPQLPSLLAARGGDEVVCETGRPSGLSIARNVGLTAARGRYIAFLDDDAIADVDWLRELRNAVSEPGIAGASGLSEPLWEGVAPRWLPGELYWSLGCSYVGMATQRAEVRNVFGGCACFDRSLFERFGGFHPDLGRGHHNLAGCEETEFCVRVLHADPGLRFLHEPAAVIHHRVPKSRQRVRYVLRRCLAEGRSKAVFRVETAGFMDSLERERTYVTKTVTAALRRELGASVRGDLVALERAGVLLTAVLCSATTFLMAGLRLRYSKKGRTDWVPLVLDPLVLVSHEPPDVTGEQSAASSSETIDGSR
jgi:glycosyltransferase involved in cell wall biosynthesis